MTSRTLRTLIEEKPFVTCPGVFDLVSAKLADRTRADALYMTGYGAVASYLGLPDAWRPIHRCSIACRLSRKPCASR
jgi:2-methylisocitrate lyase-like PEP mutase family enzyme